MSSIALQDAGGVRLVLLDESRESEFGWLFFFNSQRYLETGDVSWSLAGNGPIAVFRSGETRCLGTAQPIERYVAELDAEARGTA